MANELKTKSIQDQIDYCGEVIEVFADIAVDEDEYISWAKTLNDDDILTVPIALINKYVGALKK